MQAFFQLDLVARQFASGWQMSLHPEMMVFRFMRLCVCAVSAHRVTTQLDFKNETLKMFQPFCTQNLQFFFFSKDP